MSLFGSSGVRGLYPEQVDEDLFLRLGGALATLFDDVVVGRDVRTTGPSLQAALMAGLTATGAEAYDCDISTTPSVAHAAARFDCGAIVTASHNPPRYNGLKLWSPSGMAFDERLRDLVEAALEEPGSPVGWRDVGQVHVLEGVLDEHQEKILSSVEGAETRVAVDCGNGSTALITPHVLEAMGCQVLGINCQPDGSFPGRGPEPSDSTLGTLKAVVRRDCELGIAHDGDGDRMVAVDDQGHVVEAERLLILFARRLHAQKVVAPVNASMVLEDELGADAVVRTRVGDVFVAETLVQEQAGLGGEPSSTWIFPDFALCPDGVYAAALLCSILQGQHLSEALEDIPTYPMRRGFIPYDPSADVPRVLEEVVGSLDVRDVSRVDGWRVVFEDAWALVRLSGTEPKVRLTVEARDESRVTEIYEALLSKLSRVMG